jgi:capsid protein
MRGGRSQSLPAGADMKTLQDSRPHPNQLDLLRWLVRDIAWGAGVAPEILWEQAGLGSAATRYLMAETRRWIENQQRVQRYACQRMWTYTLAQEIKAGRVPKPTSDRWWSCKWIPQADMTIDRGRDGALEIKQIEKGLLTYQESYAKRGKDWQEEMRQLAKEKALMVELGISGDDLNTGKNL